MRGPQDRLDDVLSGRMDERLESLTKERDVQDLKRKCSEQEHDIQQTLGKALGYPWFKDDPANFPDATEDDGVCVGEHVAATLAMQAAERIAGLTEAVRKLRAALKRASWPNVVSHQDLRVLIAMCAGGSEGYTKAVGMADEYEKAQEVIANALAETAHYEVAPPREHDQG